MKRPQVLAVLALAHLCLFGLAAVPECRQELWGLNAWTFLDPVQMGLALLVVLAASLIVFRPPPWPRGPLALISVLCGFVALFFVLRDRTHLLGDGRLWLSLLRVPSPGHPHEPLSFALSRLAASGAGGDAAAVAFRVEVLGVVTGILMVGLALALAGRVSATDRGRWTAFLVFLSLGVLAFGFGYVEAYGTLAVAVFLYVLAGIAVLEGRAPLAFPAFALGLAAGLHGSGFLLVPSFFVLALSHRRPVAEWIAGALAAIVPLGVSYILVLAVMGTGGTAGGNVSFLGRGWSELLGGLRFFSTGAGAWILEHVNRGFLTSGAALSLVLAEALVRIGRGDREERRAQPPSVFLLLAAAGMYFPALLLDMQGSRGSAADWDVLAAAAIPLGALAAFFWADRLEEHCVRVGVAATLAVGLFGTTTFVLVNGRTEAALTRFEYLVIETLPGARAQSWGHESLALYYREAGDMDRVAEHYNQAVALQPDNIRLLRNAATTLSRSGRHAHATRALRGILQLEPGESGTWLRLGMEWDLAGRPDSAIVAYREALRWNPESLDAMNELARVLMRKPEGRAEARELLRTSLGRKPDQQHAGEMRRALEELERDGP